MPIPTIHGQAGVLEDPTLRFTASGKAVLNVRLAFNDSKYDEQTRQWENSRSFFVDATAWEQTAERLADQIRKGDQVYVEGRLETESWEKDGQKRSKPNLQLRTMRKFERAPQQPQQPQQQSQAGNAWGAPTTPPASSPWAGQPESHFNNMTGQQQDDTPPPF